MQKSHSACLPCFWSCYQTYRTRITQAKRFAVEQQEKMDDPNRKELSIELVSNLDQYRSGCLRPAKSMLEQISHQPTLSQLNLIETALGDYDYDFDLAMTHVQALQTKS